MVRITIMGLLLAAFFVSDASAFSMKWGGKDEALAQKKAEQLYRQAKSAYGSADYTKAIKLSTDALKVNSKHAKAWALRGKAKKDMGDVDGAMSDLNKALTIDSKLGEAYFNRAQVHEIMGEMNEAAADYKKGCASGYKTAC